MVLQPNQYRPNNRRARRASQRVHSTYIPRDPYVYRIDKRAFPAEQSGRTVFEEILRVGVYGCEEG